MNDPVSTLQFFFLRDLDKLMAEMEEFPSEQSLWRTGGDVKNPAGNLGLHIAGNLHHFIGALLGGTGYVRDRDREFSEKNVPRAEILAQLESTKKVMEVVLGAMSDAQLADVYPANHFGEGRSNLFVLLTLLAHLAYHLGQVNYLRRLVAV